MFVFLWIAMFLFGSFQMITYLSIYYLYKKLKVDVFYIIALWLVNRSFVKKECFYFRIEKYLNRPIRTLNIDHRSIHYKIIMKTPKNLIENVNPSFKS